MATNPTIRDVSKLANVSVATVSAVLNNKQIVHPNTRARVIDAIEKLNYTPRRLARNLASGKTGNIGFVLGEKHFYRNEPFYTRVFLGAEFEARKHDLYILLTSIGDEYSGSRDLPRFLHEQNVDGLIVAGKVHTRILADLFRFHIPVVLVDYGDDDFYGVRVLLDNADGTAHAVSHLFDMGHTRIGYIGGEFDHPSSKERFDGYVRAMEEHGLALPLQWVDNREEAMQADGGDRAFRRLLENNERPTAVVCSNDALAMGAIRAAMRAGIRIPEDISIVGFDDVSEGCLMDPPLTTVRVAKEDLGAVALQTLVEGLTAGFFPKSLVRVRVELIPRGTTAPPNQRGKTDKGNGKAKMQED